MNFTKWRTGFLHNWQRGGFRDLTDRTPNLVGNKNLAIVCAAPVKQF